MISKSGHVQIWIVSHSNQLGSSEANIFKISDTSI